METLGKKRCWLTLFLLFLPLAGPVASINGSYIQIPKCTLYDYIYYKICPLKTNFKTFFFFFYEIRHFCHMLQRLDTQSYLEALDLTLSCILSHSPCYAWLYRIGDGGDRGKGDAGDGKTLIWPIWFM